MEEFQLRMQDEKAELNDRIQKLGKFISSDDFKDQDEEYKNQCNAQLKSMQEYYTSLDNRMKIINRDVTIYEIHTVTESEDNEVNKIFYVKSYSPKSALAKLKKMTYIFNKKLDRIIGINLSDADDIVLPDNFDQNKIRNIYSALTENGFVLFPYEDVNSFDMILNLDENSDEIEEYTKGAYLVVG